MAKVVALVSSGRYQQEHYEDVAGVMRQHHWPKGCEEIAARDCWATICGDFADLFAADNPDFNRDRFLKACGLES